MLTLQQAFKNGYTSYSQLSSYERCPWYFYRHYVQGIKGEDSFYGAFGRAIHKVFEEDGQSLMETGRRLSKEKLLVIYDNFWRTNDMCFSGDTKREQEYYHRGKTMIDNYFNREVVVPIATEQEYIIDIPVLGVPIKAVIDVVYETPGGLVVKDYKTGRPSSREEVDSSLQMSIYGIAVKQKYGVYPIRYEFDFLQNGWVVPTYRNKLQMVQAGFRIQQIINCILRGEFEQKYENHYWCTKVCDIGKAGKCGE